MHSNSKITHNFAKINKRPHCNKRPPWNFARNLISVHHLIRASTPDQKSSLKTINVHGRLRVKETQKKNSFVYTQDF